MHKKIAPWRVAERLLIFVYSNKINVLQGLTIKNTIPGNKKVTIFLFLCYLKDFLYKNDHYKKLESNTFYINSFPTTRFG